MAGIGRPLRVRGSRDGHSTHHKSSEALVQDHFSRWSTIDHINYDSLLQAVCLLDNKPSVIIETGMSAWGINSSRLFDAYVSSFGGEFWSVDIRMRPLLQLRHHVSRLTVLTCDDSVRFLTSWSIKNKERKVDFVYLDSWDVDWSAPFAAAVHGIRELFAVLPKLHDGSLLLVDDTPRDVELCPESVRPLAEEFLRKHGMMPGKGMIINRYLDRVPGVDKIHHGYQVLYRFCA